jgi:hypothetical protein
MDQQQQQGVTVEGATQVDEGPAVAEAGAEAQEAAIPGLGTEEPLQIWRKKYMSEELRKLFEEHGHVPLPATADKHYASANRFLSCWLLWEWMAKGPPEDKDGLGLLDK